MGEIIDLWAKLKRYYKFTPSELKSFAVSVFIIAFVINFKEWGPGDTFDFGIGLFNLFNSILIVTLAMIIHHSAQQASALSVGYRVEYKMWSYGLIISLVLAFVTRGWFWFIIPGGIMHHHLAGHKLGFFRYGLNYFAVGLSSLMGPVSNLMFVVVLKLINSVFQSALIEKAIVFNILYAVWTILPIPPADGSRMFFGSRMVYAFGFFAVVSGAFLLWIDIPVWFAVIGALLIGFICWILYYIFWEKGFWKGPY